jgi:hypothetical protein
LRETAKRDGKHLCTVDVPGLCFQGAISGERRLQLIELLTEIFKELRVKQEDQS